MSEVRTIYFANAGVPATGLTPTWNSLKNAVTGADITPQPSITEVGGGFYKFTADPGVGVRWCGVVDGGVSLTVNTDRYIPVLVGDSDLAKDTMVLCTPVYDDTSDTLTFFVFMLRNGQIVEGGTNAEVVLYDSGHSDLFTISGSSATNGVFILSKNTPGIASGEGYYCVGTITINSIDFVSVETMLTLD